MDHNDWAITACIQWPNGELFNKDAPFGTYHVEAPTAEKAIELLKDDFRGCKVTIHGKPIHSIVTEDEYENGD